MKTLLSIWSEIYSRGGLAWVAGGPDENSSCFDTFGPIIYTYFMISPKSASVSQAPIFIARPPLQVYNGLN